MTTTLSGLGLMWTGHGIAWSRSPQPTLRNPAGRAEAASGCAASALASATTCGGTEASACLAAAIDDPAPPGDANPTSGTTVNTTHKTATLRRTKPPLSESHSPAEETRASNTSIIRMEAWLFPSRRPPPLLNQGLSERTSAQPEVRTPDPARLADTGDPCEPQEWPRGASTDGQRRHRGGVA